MDSVRPLKIKISISIDEDIVNRLRTMAEKDDRALSSCINLILRNHLSGTDNTLQVPAAKPFEEW